MFEPEQNDSFTEATAPFVDVPLETGLTQAAFLAAKRGELSLLEVLLGPSIQSEKEKHIELSAKITKVDDVVRIYTFMIKLTEVRIATIREFESLKPEYQNYRVLNTLLNERIVKEVIEGQVDSMGLRGDVYVEECRELNNDPLIEIALDIDSPLEEVVSQSTIKTFLRANHVPFTDEQQYVHYWVAKGLALAFSNVWYERFAYRATKMPMASINNEDELKQTLETLYQMHKRYEDYASDNADIKRPNITTVDELEHALLARCRRQRGLVVDLLQDKSGRFTPEIIEFLEHALYCLQVELEEEGFAHLNASENKPKSKWISHQITTFKNNTLMHIAAEYKRYRMVSLLMKYGLDVTTPNQDGKTPAALADMDEETLIDFALKYSREKESDFLEKSKEVVKKYEENANIILTSPVKKLFYRLFNNLPILEKRVNHDVPELYAKLRLAYQNLSDMEFAVAAIRLYHQAERGFRNRSALHRSIMNLVIRYLTEQSFGVKDAEDIQRIMQITGLGTPEGEKVYEMEIMQVRETVKRLEEVITAKGGVIACLQSENELLRREHSSAIEGIRERDEVIEEQKQAIETQNIEMENLKQIVIEQGKTIAKTQSDLSEMKAMMQQLLMQQNKPLQITQAKDIPSAAVSVSNHASTLYGASPDGFSPSPDGGVRMDQFKLSGATPE